MKRGDVVLIEADRGGPREATIESVGPKFITADRIRFSAEPIADGSHYAEYGNRLWPDRATYDAAKWRRAALIELPRLLGKAPMEALREVARVLGYEAAP